MAATSSTISPGVKLPSGLAGASVSPAALAKLPAAAHGGYVQAYAHSLQTVFLVAVPIAAIAFLLTWLLPEVTLRKTIGAVDPGETFARPADRSSVQELERALTVLAGKENRAELFRRLATRARVELDPAVCWLLLRLARHPGYTVTQLAREPAISPGRIQGLIQRMLDDGVATIPALPGTSPDEQRPVLTGAGQDAVERLVTAHRQRLAELLDGWSPTEHAELAELVHRLTGELLDDEQAPPRAAPVAVH